MFKEEWQNALALLHGNPLLGIAAMGVVALLFYFRPKEMFRLSAFCLFLVVAFYVMTLLIGTVGSGSKQKDQMIYKSKQVLGE